MKKDTKAVEQALKNAKPGGKAPKGYHWTPDGMQKDSPIKTAAKKVAKKFNGGAFQKVKKSVFGIK